MHHFKTHLDLPWPTLTVLNLSFYPLLGWKCRTLKFELSYLLGITKVGLKVSGQKTLVKNMLAQRNIGPRKMLGQKNGLILKYFVSETFGSNRCEIKECLVSKNFRIKKKLGSKINGSKRILCPNLFFGLNFILVKTKFDWIECGSKCFLGQNILWVKKVLGQKKSLGTKTFQFHSCIWRKIKAWKYLSPKIFLSKKIWVFNKLLVVKENLVLKLLGSSNSFGSLRNFW